MNRTTPAGAPRRRKRRTDQDFLWKAFLQFFLQAFLLLCKPQLYRAIDWSRKPEFLEQELRNALRRFFKRKKFADLLIKVWLKNGEEKWILILLEVQAYFDPKFCERIFEYYLLVINKFLIKDIAIFALYTGESSPKIFDRFEHEVFGTSVRLKFNAVQATKLKEEALMRSKNPVALAFLANIWRLQTKNDLIKRAEKIDQLADLLAARKYDVDWFYEICIFVRDLMNLSPNLENEFAMKASNQKQRRKKEPIFPLMPSRGDKPLVDAIYESYYGESPVVLHKQLKASKKAEEQAKLAEEQAKLAEEQAKLAEEQAKLAEEQARVLLEKSVQLLAKNLAWDADKIATQMEIDVSLVRQILSGSSN